MSYDYDISETVETMARRIFELCGAEDDYCVQDVSSNTIVFGSVNRIQLNKYGWMAFEHACTPRFYANFNELTGRES